MLIIQDVILITAGVVAKPEYLGEILRLSKEHVARSLAEPGCLAHAVHQDASDPNRIVFLEKWADLDAVRAHFGVPAARDFVRAIAPLSAEQLPLEIYEATPIDPPGRSPAPGAASG